MFNNPNFYAYQYYQPRASLFNSLKRLNFSQILNGTQKTLNVINQAIPIVHQITPLWNNAKTIFKIANAINEDKPTTTNHQTKKINNETKTKNINENNQTQRKDIKYNEPIFFL